MNIYILFSIALKCVLSCLSLFHFVFYLVQSNTRYFVSHLERFTYQYKLFYIYMLFSICPRLILFVIC